MSERPAGFLLRLLASVTDTTLLLIPHLLFGLYIAGSRTLSELGFASMLYFIFITGASLGLLFLYPYMVSRVGATPGKLLTGLRITDEEGQLLSFKRSLFRTLVGYPFSSLYFGLGYFSIIKDENKQGWHDKAVGSRVWVVQTLWPLALVSAVTIISLNAFLLYRVYTTFINSPLKQQFVELATPKRKIPKLLSSPSAFPSFEQYKSAEDDAF